MTNNELLTQSVISNDIDGVRKALKQGATDIDRAFVLAAEMAQKSILLLLKAEKHIPKEVIQYAKSRCANGSKEILNEMDSSGAHATILPKFKCLRCQKRPITFYSTRKTTLCGDCWYEVDYSEKYEDEWIAHNWDSIRKK